MDDDSQTLTPRMEHSVPSFWPFAAAIEMQEAGLKLFQNNLKFLMEAGEIDHPTPPQWATANVVQADMDTMRLRNFTPAGHDAKGIPVLIDAPYAGHSATIADFDKGQSLVETLLASGLDRVFATDWKSATPEMAEYNIDKYLGELNAAVDDLGGKVHLIGLCQGGWLSAMLAARFPQKVQTLVLAGAPIDTAAGNGPIKNMANSVSLSFYQDLVRAGGGRMLGRVMLAGWKNMHPKKQYLEKYVDLYEHIEDKNYLTRTEKFESWYENPLDLPGTYYLQAIEDLFKRNTFARGEFVGLGQTLNLKAITCPVYLLAGESDDITTKEQVFEAEPLLGTPPDKIIKTLTPGGHIGLFMGSNTLRTVWPGIAEWIKRN